MIDADRDDKIIGCNLANTKHLKLSQLYLSRFLFFLLGKVVIGHGWCNNVSS